MAFGDFARLDGYDPNASFPPGSDADEARWAAEVAAQRLRRGNVRQQGEGAPRAEAVMGALAEIVRPIVETPGRTMAQNPYPPGSELAHAYEDQRSRAANVWAGERMVDMIGSGLVAGPKRAAATLGTIPIADARMFGIKPSVQFGGLIEQAVKNTPGSAIDDGMLRMRVVRGQRPEQEMMDSVRGGVFYLPETDAARRYLNVYKKGGTGPGLHYGGPQIISGETAFANPLLAKGATGGKVPEAAYAQIMNDKKAMKGLDEATREAMNYAWMNQGVGGIKQIDMVERFLSKHAPELADNAADILRNSTKGNTLRYALQEAAIGAAARKAGHDAIVGYTASRTRPPKFSEVFDVRERSYPSPSGDFDVWPREMFGGLARQDSYQR